MQGGWPLRGLKFHTRNNLDGFVRNEPHKSEKSSAQEESRSGERGTEEQGQRVMEESSHFVVCELGCMLVQDQEVGAAARSSQTPVSTVTILLNQRRHHCLDLSTKETRSIDGCLTRHKISDRARERALIGRKTGRCDFIG